MNITAIDPGYTHSAVVTFDGERVTERLYDTNDVVLGLVWAYTNPVGALVIEQVESYGMTVGKEVFGTVWWAGRFHQAWLEGGAVQYPYQMPRREVKLHLCGQSRAKDANIRQALIDRFGPTKEQAIGRKKSPGPLYGISGDMWAALAVAVTWWDTRRL
jgi:hypothetical protein